MEKISVISYKENPAKTVTQYIAGQEVTYIYSPKSRRRLRRYLNGCGAEKAVLLGEVPQFVTDVLRKAEIKICTGESLMRTIYPQLISRAAKMSKDCNCCTVYDKNADGDTLEIIKCAASHFKYVSLCSEREDVTHLAEQIMDMTGLALKIGESDGVGIVCSGRGGRQKVRVDLTESSKTVFFDTERNIISPSLAEALAGDDLGGDVLDRLKLKIYSLC